MEDAAAILDGQLAQFHRGMLNDRTRTGAFLEAIAQVVRPGDVVLDIGTGTGILAMAAARAGAKHVYAIEAGPISDVAARLFKANGLEDRITLLRGLSTTVTLPEPADVLVTELIGNSPLTERIMPVVADAHARLLKGGARMIPSRLRLYGVPVSIPAGMFETVHVSDGDVEKWREWYGFDLSQMVQVSERAHAQIFVTPQRCRNWPRLGQPSIIADIDLAAPPLEVCAIGTPVAIESDGVLSGLLIFFEAVLAPDTTLSTDPLHVGADNHWKMPLVCPHDPASVAAGDEVGVVYHWREKISTSDPTKTEQQDILFLLPAIRRMAATA